MKLKGHTQPRDFKAINPWQRLLVLAMVTFTIAPFAPLVIQSLAFRWAWPNILPTVWWHEQRGLSPLPLAWDYVFSSSSRVAEATANTLGIGIAVTLLCLVVCLPAARVLAQSNFRGKSQLEFLIVLPLLLPEAAIGIALLMIFIGLGLAGTYVGVIIVHLIPTIPYMVRMLTAVYQGHGTEAEDHARVLGASRSQVFFQVTLPMILPGVIAGCLFTFLVSTNLFLLTFFIGQGEIITLPTLLFAKISGGALNATGAGIALIASLPGIILLFFTDRFIRSYPLAT
ncbi:Molybdenum transport system permease protein ModB [Pseudovibrio axinellae]|uniref:Molybdenum transport system permease protein ModB n=1 Tax=Pseudovibrio axinellae TaxID=989403 RepID=A0A165VTQ0_9HYPH|nr:ABC transporter permease subunit [Pseudovibrio axinellae]KZL15427.1 Molybdenum transport system permease protein ModB [Pseudovibrio axinellae]SER56006.1 putative spermidine/putrescine transport system permease protein [Pseudovibrio axinellae]